MLARLDELIRRTPADRDRYMDFLRAFSILVVVVGHWLIGMIYWRDGVIGTRSAIGVTNWAWALTWLLQVMPIFFFVGGFSNYATFEAMRRRGDGYREFVRARLVRLLKPTAIFLGIWVIAQVVLHAIDEGGDKAIRGSFLPFAPLWFLVVYMGLVVTVPVWDRLDRRWGELVPIALAAAAMGFWRSPVQAVGSSISAAGIS